MMVLGAFELSLLQKLQDPLPLCPHPFAKLGQDLGCGEQTILTAIRKLKAEGVIRRLRANISYRTLGRIASLVTVHVPDDKFDTVAKAVSLLPGVSHNYCRAHYYNLWFTLQAKSQIAIDVTLNGLREDFDLDFHSLPAICLFKLDARFNPAGPGAVITDHAVPTIRQLPEIPPEPVELSSDEKAALSFIQNELALTGSPFVVADRSGSKDLLPSIEQLRHKGVLTKIAAVLDYTRLGYTANAMFCLEVPGERIESAGTELARCSLISHCYQRQTFPGWPFNLYAMCHAAEMETIDSFTASFSIRHNLPNYQLLPTVAELKKEPVKITD